MPRANGEDRRVCPACRVNAAPGSRSCVACGAQLTPEKVKKIEASPKVVADRQTAGVAGLSEVPTADVGFFDKISSDMTSGSSAGSSAPLQTDVQSTAVFMGLDVSELPAADEPAEQDSAHDLLRQKADAAFAALVKRSAGRRPAMSVLLTRKISQLLATPQQQQQDISRRIEELGRSRSPAVLETLAAFSMKVQKDTRRAVAVALGHIRHPDASAILLKLLCDGSMVVSEAAAQSLVLNGDRETLLPLLYATLTSRGLRKVICTSIEKVAAERRTLWIECLQMPQVQSDPALFALAIGLLSRLTGAEFYDTFVSALEHRQPVVRAAAIEAILRTGNKRAVSLVNTALNDTAPEVRRQAAAAAAELTSPRTLELLGVLLKDADHSVRLQAAHTISKLTSTALREQISSRLSIETDPEVLNAMVACLATECPPSGVAQLLVFAANSESPLRMQSIRALRKLRCPEAQGLFTEFLDDNDEGLRRQAVEYLGARRVRPLLPRLEQKLLRDPSEPVRAAAAKALGEILEKTSIPTLEKALEDAGPVRLQSLISLIRYGQASVGPAVIGLLRDSVPEVRYQAVRGIATLKLTDAAAAAESLLDDPDEIVRRGAEKTLHELDAASSFRTLLLRLRKLRNRCLRLLPASLLGFLPAGWVLAVVAAVILLLTAGPVLYLRYRQFNPAVAIPIGVVKAIAVSEATDRLLILRIAGVLDIWSLKDHTLQQRVALTESPGTLSIDRGGGVVFVSGKDVVRLSHEQPGNPESAKRYSLPSLPKGSFYHAETDSMCVIVEGAPKSRLLRVKCDDLTVAAEFPLDQVVTGRGALSTDGMLAVFVTPEGGLAVFDLKNNKSTVIPAGKLLPADSAGPIERVAFRSDMKYLAVSGTNCGILVLQTASLKLVKHITAPGASSFATVGFSGESLVGLCQSGEYSRLRGDYQAVEEGRITTLPQIDMVQFFGSGSQVVTASLDESSVWLVDFGTGSVSHTFSVD